MDVFEYRSSRVIAKDGIFEISDAPESDISGMFMRNTRKNQWTLRRY